MLSMLSSSIFIKKNSSVYLDDIVLSYLLKAHDFIFLNVDLLSFIEMASFFTIYGGQVSVQNI